MLDNKLKELEALRAKQAALEAEVASERAAELKALPKQYGFESAEEFIDAVIAATGAGRRRGRPVGAKTSGKRRTRAVITNETRAQVKALVKEGKTGAEIASKLGISLPSVQNIKKALGLVKERK